MGLDQRSFLQTLTYTATAPVADIRQDMEAIARLDRRVERQQQFWANLCIGGFAIAFIAIFLAAFGGVWGLAILLPALAIGIISLVVLMGDSRTNLENARYNLTKNLVSMLERDLEPNTPIQTRLVLSPTTHPSKKVRTTPHARKPGWSVDRFADQWLVLRGRFTDHTRFQLTLTDLHQTASGWQQGLSGKNKYKTKQKPRGSVITLSLRCPRRKYGALQALEQDAPGAIQLPGGVKVTKLQVTDQGLYLAVKAIPDSSHDRDDTYKTVTMMFLSLYQILNLVRTLSKPRSG